MARTPDARPPTPSRGVLSRFPLLADLLRDLRGLESAEEARAAQEARQRRLDGMPENVGRVSVPWVERGRVYYLTAAQQKVVQVLTESLAHREPEVHESVLLREAGHPRARKLADIFDGTGGEPALGTLILPGHKPGRYRLAPPPAENGGDEVTRTPPEY